MTICIHHSGKLGLHQRQFYEPLCIQCQTQQSTLQLANTYDYNYLYQSNAKHAYQQLEY